MKKKTMMTKMQWMTMSDVWGSNDTLGMLPCEPTFLVQPNHAMVSFPSP